MRVVLDTNVIVSGFMSRNAPPARVLRAVDTGEIVPVFDQRMIDEYEEVVQRPRIATRLDAAEALAWIAAMQRVGVRWAEVPRYDRQLRDEDDRPFLEVALASGAVNITGNTKDYPPDADIDVLTPAEFANRTFGE